MGEAYKGTHIAEEAGVTQALADVAARLDTGEYNKLRWRDKVSRLIGRRGVTGVKPNVDVTIFGTGNGEDEHFSGGYDELMQVAERRLVASVGALNARHGTIDKMSVTGAIDWGDDPKRDPVRFERRAIVADTVAHNRAVRSVNTALAIHGSKDIAITK